ncbi:hypothetical protein ACU4HD_46675 [Cupriavidus basilensis]
MHGIFRTAHGQQAARGAVGQGGLCDQLGWQIEIEIGQRQHEKWRRRGLRQVMVAGAGTIGRNRKVRHYETPCAVSRPFRH